LTKKTFEKLLLEAIDEALGLLGESARQSTYFHLQHKFKVVRNDIPHHLEDFEGGLEKIFGVGAKYIEISIMKKLYEKTGKPFKWNENEELVFTKYVDAVRKGFNEKRNVETVEA
jgi:hypothetical protein